MSILKRNFSKKEIQKLYEEGGSQKVFSSMKKVESFFCEDDFSLEVVMLLNKRDEKKFKEHIENAFRIISETSSDTRNL